jgi:hypothetical protein
VSLWGERPSPWQRWALGPWGDTFGRGHLSLTPSTCWPLSGALQTGASRPLNRNTPRHRLAVAARERHLREVHRDPRGAVCLTYIKAPPHPRRSLSMGHNRGAPLRGPDTAPPPRPQTPWWGRASRRLNDWYRPARTTIFGPCLGPVLRPHQIDHRPFRPGLVPRDQVRRLPPPAGARRRTRAVTVTTAKGGISDDQTIWGVVITIARCRCSLRLHAEEVGSLGPRSVSCRLWLSPF